MSERYPVGKNWVQIINSMDEPVPIALVADSASQQFTFDEDGGLAIIDWAHHNLHEGKLFRSHYYEILNINDTIDVVLVTPNQDVEYHFEGILSTSGGALFQFFEGTQQGGDGTQRAVYNSNRQSNNSNTMHVFINPTITDVGLEIEGGYVGAGNTQGGIVRAEDEWDLNFNETYLLRVTSLGNTNRITIRLDWYEE